MSKSYYNHTKKSPSKNKTSDDLKDSLIDTIGDDNERKMLIIKTQKTWTNKTWMQIAEMAKCSTEEARGIWRAIKDSEDFDLESEASAEQRRQLRKFDMMELELWDAWMASKQDKTRTKEEEGFSSKGDFNKSSRETIGRDPSVPYMTEIRLIQEARRKLLGMEKLAEINFNQQNNNQFVFAGAGEPLVSSEHEAFIHKPNEITAPSLGGDNSPPPLLPENSL